MNCWKQVEEEYESLVYPYESDIKKQIEETMESYVGTKKQIEAEEERLKKELKEVVKVKRQQYYETQSLLVEKWKQLCYEEYFHGYPKELFDLCYSPAYERGHSSGYNEVEILICDMSDSYIAAFNLGRKLVFKD